MQSALITKTNSLESYKGSTSTRMAMLLWLNPRDKVNIMNMIGPHEQQQVHSHV
jgi:hypothetical protein